VITYEADEYVAKIHSDGLIQVFCRMEPVLIETRYTGGQSSVKTIDRSNADSSEKKMLNTIGRMPLFAATYSGKGLWHCDIDAGFQRWNGIKTGVALSKAMKKYGFDKEVISKILRKGRKHEWGCCPRQW